MKRFVLVPACIIGFALSMMMRIVMRGPGLQVQMPPTLDHTLLPGQPLPHGASCHYEMPNLACNYLRGDVNIHFVLKDRVIQQTYLFTYPSGLQMGETMLAWGEPIGVVRHPFPAVQVYWADKSAFLLTRRGFSPMSRVGFICFGPPDKNMQPWKGYQSN
jgi:hypothetical protein